MLQPSDGACHGLPKIVTILFLALGALSVLASDPETQAEKPSPTVPGTQATVDHIMTQAVRNIARRYNLNEEQTRYTDELMRRDVTQFLQTHEKEIWPIIRELLSVQLKGKPPDDLGKVKEIGNAAGPILQKAMKAILRGNKEWRMYLTDEQKVMHDHDLEEMNKTFETMEKNFESWAQGNPTDAPIFPPPAGPNGIPRRPHKPREGMPPPVIEIEPSVFDTIVAMFLNDYRDLDQGQIDSARSILVEYKAKANDFQNSKKTELAQVAAEQREAMTKRDHKQIAEAERKRKKLLQPFHALVNEMQVRLHGLLTTTQRQRHAAGATQPGPREGGGVTLKRRAEEGPTEPRAGQAKPPASAKDKTPSKPKKSTDSQAEKPSSGKTD